MRLFTCDACKNTLHFDNDSCVVCLHRLGFVAERRVMTALEPAGDHWHSAGLGEDFAFCANAEHAACNWLLPTAEAGGYCLACRHNGLIPDLSDPDGLAAFRRLTAAERHLFYSLIEWRLPVPTRAEDAEGGLGFDFLIDTVAADGSVTPARTGHENGVISLAISEADDAERERQRSRLGEPLRTLLGHFRHEIGHYYWVRLVERGGKLDDFRRLFGDERADYQTALQHHYAEGPPANWQEQHVSAYAAAHPWEDFAETFAHYLHMVDALETAGALGFLGSGALETGELDGSPYHEPEFSRLVAAWPPLTIAINELNRSLGQRDVYPFVLSDRVFAKLAFIHELILPWWRLDPAGG